MVADQQDAFSGLATGKIGYRVFLKAILNFLPSFCSVTLCGKVAKNPTKYHLWPKNLTLICDHDQHQVTFCLFKFDSGT